MKLRDWVWFGVIGVVAAALVLVWAQGIQGERRAEAVYQRGIVPVSFVSTRGHVDDGHLTPGHTPYDYDVGDGVPGMSRGTQAPADLMIVVHGLNNDQVKAVNRFGIAKESLAKCGYRGVVIGFSWDGATNIDPFGATGYQVAKHNATVNGSKLAQFLADYRAKNPETKLRLLGYSMGARVALEAAYQLASDPKFLWQSWKVDSIHLVGASIQNEDVETGARYGPAIERRVGHLYNYYSPLDSKLGQYFRLLEMDRALGRNDIEHPDRKPRNYISHDVRDLLPAVGPGGEIDLKGTRGRNHSGYLGTRNDMGTLVDVGAMRVVVDDIRREAS